MKQKALIVCSESPYPTVVGGYERLIKDYESYVFADYDVYLLVCRWDSLQQLLHYGAPIEDEQQRKILEQDFAFALFIHSDLDYADGILLGPLIDRIPSFSFTQFHPNEEIADERFKGIITHYSENPHKNVLLLGGSYDPNIFYKNRQSGDFILCVARIHPRKNQLELVESYRQRIFEKHKIPLYLVGGSANDDYYFMVNQFVDHVSVRSTSDNGHLMAETNWRTSKEIAELCNRARMFVMPSEEESFCIAMIEAMACGTTCVVNGWYGGFEENDLRPNVYGNITGKEGSILDQIDEALSRDIRIDPSEWVKKFSLANTRERLMNFIHERL